MLLTGVGSRYNALAPDYTNSVLARVVTGIGVLLIAPQIPHMSVLGAMMAIAGWLVLAAIVAQFSANTRGRHYEEISL
jgi:hypothetical protein